MAPPSAVVVAMDGPAGAGKSTVARRVAQALGYTLLDTGALYRAVALACERAAVQWSDPDGCTRVAYDLVERGALVIEPTTGSGMRVVLESVDVSDAIRTPSISMGASTVSAIPGVRAALLDSQRHFVERGTARGVVCEGRDIGTVVFPRAPLKIFLTASVDERARRRFAELVAAGATNLTLEGTRAEVIARDAQDMGRKIAPLRQADDAVVIDSTGNEIERTIEIVLALVRERVPSASPSAGPSSGKET